MSGICRNIKCPLIVAGGVEDHAHLLSELHPATSVADFERDVKANASRFLHEEFAELHEFAWQVSYSAFSVSPSIEPKVRRYIENQEEHHRTRSFLDEMRWLYEAHGLTFDPQAWASDGQ
jgi:REP element-mobilizing transposase RayT